MLADLSYMVLNMQHSCTIAKMGGGGQWVVEKAKGVLGNMMESSRINPLKLWVVTFLKCVLCCGAVWDFPKVTACCMQGTHSKPSSKQWPLLTPARVEPCSQNLPTMWRVSD